MKKNPYLVRFTCFFTVFLLFSCKQDALPSNKKERDVPQQSHVESTETKIPEHKSTSEIVEFKAKVQAFNELPVYFSINGTFESSQPSYKTGDAFEAGDLLFQINNAEIFAQIKNKKLALKALLTDQQATFGASFPTELALFQAWKEAISPAELLPQLPSFSPNALMWLKKNTIKEAHDSVQKLENSVERYFYLAPFSGYFTNDFSPGKAKVVAHQRIASIAKANIFCLKTEVPMEVFQTIDQVKNVQLSFPKGLVAGKIIASEKKNASTVEVKITTDEKLSRKELNQVVPVTITYSKVAS